MFQSIGSLVGKLVYKMFGWQFEPLPDYWQRRQVLVAFPHTTIADTVMAFAGFGIIKQRGHIIVKKEAFVWPISWLLHLLGGIPVDRSSSHGLVQQMVAQFEGRDSFHLALVPEGTRKGVDAIKTGFWFIAKGAKVPIVCWYIDSANKRTRWAGQIVPSDNMHEDLLKMRELYLKVGYDIPFRPANENMKPSSESVS